MKKKLAVVGLILGWSLWAEAQPGTIVREYVKSFKTYPYADPDPIPKANKIYPYFRYDGYTDDPVQLPWKVVELENDYIKVMILPEVGGKIWTAIEKSTGKPFIYYNEVIKFRDVAMRGPWTSGGIEANYGIIGHTPNCATPVDYTIIHRDDGSVSCVIGVLDLLTRTNWRLDINLPKDKAYFTTSSFWFNGSPTEQPYYTWMNTGIKASGNLQFIYPGTDYVGHNGEHSDWPIHPENKRDLSFYENNDFGGYKSYHVFGKYTDFFGGYWHDEGFGMGRYAPHDEKAGKKIWVWGLSDQGMIWEKLLTDTNGQYVEVQSGRLFNQASPGSTFTPFKHKGFTPGTSDVWTEYWFPVLNTEGFVAANQYGALNLQQENGWLKIYLSPLQTMHEDLTIKSGDHMLYAKEVQLKPLQLFVDSIRFDGDDEKLKVSLGTNKLVYEASPEANVLTRPIDTPANFDWDSVYGLYLQGKEKSRQRDDVAAEEKLRACLTLDPNYLPALTDLSMILYRRMQYGEALATAKKAFSINTYDPAANYYYGLVNEKIGNLTDAKDGFDIAAMGMEYRSASYAALSRIYLTQDEYEKSVQYANKSLDFNRYELNAYQQMAVANRLSGDRIEAEKALESISAIDPLNHFAHFEKYCWNKTEENKTNFIGAIKAELPQETFLELAIWYHDLGRDEEAREVLTLSPKSVKINYWLAFLQQTPLAIQLLKPDLFFPFRPETAKVLQNLIKQNDYWLLKFHLALVHWKLNNLDQASDLFHECADQPNEALFYASRAAFLKQIGSEDYAKDLLKAINLDNKEWRYTKELTNYYLDIKKWDKANQIAGQYYKKFPENYIIGLLYAKTLLKTAQYTEANKVLGNINVLPNEGATEGRQLYRETQLMLAVRQMEKRKYADALKYLKAARRWPDNLGVGKPYDSDIDERLEDWLSMICYEKTGDQQLADAMINKILSYDIKSSNGATKRSVNNLLTLKALKRVGKAEKADALLADWISIDKEDVITEWVVQTLREQEADIARESAVDVNYRVMKALGPEIFKN